MKNEKLAEDLATVLETLANSGDCGKRAIVTYCDDYVKADFFDGFILKLNSNGTWSFENY